MPQMAPIGWLSLFLIFSMSYMMFNMFNYYTLVPSLSFKKLNKNMNYNSMNWKW
uniref:ATP synthase complex subunit 8 n=1 Tax=Tomosvaryella palliditarsis TaxID=1743456 RepID=A0A7G7CDS8_9MUSC|nr:ATP synthase F0 subunit 8 [Tomosvaryella palliditarsis]